MARNMVESRNAGALCSAVVVMVLAFVTAGAGLAQEASLTISGYIGDGSGRVILGIEALEQLPIVSFTTGTIWTTGERRFSGPTLASVLALVVAGDGDLNLMALNDYAMKMPRGLVGATAPIIATRIDEEPFSIVENGPFWIVFPYDESRAYRSELHFATSVWQLTEIAVLPE